MFKKSPLLTTTFSLLDIMAATPMRGDLVIKTKQRAHDIFGDWSRSFCASTWNAYPRIDDLGILLNYETDDTVSVYWQRFGEIWIVGTNEIEKCSNLRLRK